MDLQTAKDAVRTARIAWHATIGKDVDKDFDVIKNLNSAIEACRSGFLTTIPGPQTRMEPIRRGCF
jgi:hypothetical protein